MNKIIVQLCFLHPIQAQCCFVAHPLSHQTPPKHFEQGYFHRDNRKEDIQLMIFEQVTVASFSHVLDQKWIQYTKMFIYKVFWNM